MKLLSRNLFFMIVVAFLVLAWFTPVTFAGTCPGSVEAQGGIPYSFGSYYYHYIDGIPDGAPAAHIDGLFYYYDAPTAVPAGEYPTSQGLSWAGWFVNAYNVWYPGGAWYSDPHTAGISGAAFTANSITIVMLSYDNVQTTSNNAVQFAVMGGVGSLTQTPTFNFDLINDGLPGGGGYNCIVPMQAIPQITIAGRDNNNPVTAQLNWTNPGHWSYGPAGHIEYMYGFRIYYYDVPTGGPATPPVENTRSTWTAVTDLEGGLWQIGDPLPHSITIDQPLEGRCFFFALAPVGAGNCGAKAYEDTPFMTGFVGQGSSNTLEYNPTSITLLRFTAEQVNLSSLILWETGSEVNTAGFNVLRAATPDGRKTKINASLIPSTGGPGLGAVYKIQDKQVKTGSTYYYWLEEIEQSGQKLEYGSVGVTITGRESRIN